MLAMHYVELGLGDISLFDNKHSTLRTLPAVSNDNFGCHLMMRKI